MHSYRSAPTPYQSMLLPWDCRWSISGVMYAVDPQIESVKAYSCTSSFNNSLDKPKSVSLTCPSPEIRILSGFKSL